MAEARRPGRRDFAKDIPAPEMEALLKERAAVTDEAMRALALQRGLAVRDALIAKGLPGDRLFLAAPKLRASGAGDAAWTPRVQLELSTNRRRTDDEPTMKRRPAAASWRHHWGIHPARR